MASPSPLMIMWASLLLLLLFSATSPCVAGGQFAGLNRITSKRRTIRHVTHFRGGAFVDSDEEYDSDEYDSDDEDEPIVAKAKKLASSTKNKVQKAKGAAAKAKVSVAMASSGGGDGGLGGLYRHYVPYIIRACLNPFTLLSMTKGYFISLFDINYLREVSRDTSSPGSEVRVTVVDKEKPKTDVHTQQRTRFCILPRAYPSTCFAGVEFWKRRHPVRPT